MEFALGMPIFILLFLGAVELSNYIYTNQKIKNGAYNVLNLINQQMNVSREQLNTISAIVPDVMRPLPMPADGYVVYVTAIQRDSNGDGAYIRWQNTFGNESAGPSRFSFSGEGLPGANPVTADQVRGFEFMEGDQLISVELYAVYTPFIDTAATRSLLGLEDGYIYFFASARPRKGAFQFAPDEIR